MKDLKKIAKRIKELDVKYEDINSTEIEKEMANIMESLSFEELLEIDSENIDALNGIGSAYMKLNNLDEAENYYDKSLSICENSSAFLNKGNIWKHRNNNEKALYYYDKHVKLTRI